MAIDETVCISVGSTSMNSADVFGWQIEPDSELYVLDEDGDLYDSGKLVIRNYMDSFNLEFQREDPGDEKMKDNEVSVYEVSVYHVLTKSWVCWQEPYVGNKDNIRAWVASKHDIDIDLLDNYDWLVQQYDTVRKSLDE